MAALKSMVLSFLAFSSLSAAAALSPRQACTTEWDCTLFTQGCYDSVCSDYPNGYIRTPRTSCSTISDCEFDENCTDGYCQAVSVRKRDDAETCTTEWDCTLFTQGCYDGACSNYPDGYIRTPRTSCTTISDCEFDENCTDGYCQAVSV